MADCKTLITLKWTICKNIYVHTTSFANFNDKYIRAPINLFILNEKKVDVFLNCVYLYLTVESLSVWVIAMVCRPQQQWNISLNIQNLFNLLMLLNITDWKYSVYYFILYSVKQFLLLFLYRIEHNINFEKCCHQIMYSFSIVECKKWVISLFK